MRYHIVVILLFISIPAFSQQSNWEAAGIHTGGKYINTICNDTVNDVLYVGGYLWFSNNLDSGYVLRFRNNKWDTMPNLFNGLNGIVRSIVQYHGEIYVGGTFDKVDSILTGSIAKWDGNSWSKVGNGLWASASNKYGNIWKLRVYNDTLYAVGIFDSSGGVTGINSLAKWNGIKWEAVNDLPLLSHSGPYNDLRDVGFYGNKVFVGGNFQNDTIDDLVMFDGANWVKPDIYVGGGYGEVDVITNYKGELYIGGNLDMNTNSYIAKYNGTFWSNVGTGLSGGFYIPTDFRVHNNELYVSGQFYYAGGIPAKCLAKWDGVRWCALGGNFFRGVISALEFYHDTLFVACLDSVDNVFANGLARWIGGSYVDSCGVSNIISKNNIQPFKISIFPNPTTNSLVINGEQICEVQVHNSIGQIVKQFSNKTKNELVINVSDLKSGIYLISVFTSKGNYTQKIFKE